MNEGRVVPDLWAHQVLSIERAKELDNLALFHDPGCGKSRTAVEIAKWWYKKNDRILRTLILAPQVVCPQWGSEFKRYSDITSDKIKILNKAGPKRARQFLEATYKHTEGFIAVMNYEAVPTTEMYSLLLNWKPEIIIYDESHRCKDHSSVRFKKLRPLSQGAKHRLLLTGSPVLNSPLDLFAQYYLMDNGRTFGDNYFTFRATYLYDKNSSMPKHVYFPNWVPRPDAAPRLAKILSETAVQAKKEECLSLPPEVYVEIPVGLGSEQLKAYREMKKHYVTFVKENVVQANLAITQTLRLRQILSGFVPGPDGEPVYFEDNPRLDALVDKIRDLSLSGKTIIWTDYIASYSLITKALKKVGIASVMLTGSETAGQKEKNVKEFREGKTPVVIANPQSVGLGIELTEASSSIYYSRSYSQESAIQSAARNYRGGTEKFHTKVTRYDLVATFDDEEISLDRVILDCLRNKGDLAKSLLSWANST